MSAVPRRKHLLLLAVLIGIHVGSPLLVHRGAATRLLSDTVFVATGLYVFFVVCSERWQRIIGFTLFLPVVVGNVGLYAQLPGIQRTSSVVFHSACIAFLGFAVTVIVRDLFSQTVIKGDDVIGAICGYILGAMVWGNLYALTYLFAPQAFSLSPAITMQLADWQHRRALFDYMSFTTLTSLGYGDITPVGQPVYTLTWLEVLFGQFYMAVVVAQMVGLKLAQAIRGRGQDSR